MHTEEIHTLAELALQTGIALQEGQCLLIRGDSIHLPAALALEEAAYRRGARYVHIDLDAPRSALHRANMRRQEYLGFVPPFRKAIVETLVQDHWSLIRIDGEEDPSIMKQVNGDYHAINEKARREVELPCSRATGRGDMTWNIFPVATPAWAATVFGGDSTQDKTEKLQTILAKILRLDTPDPLAAWETHNRELHRRCRVLNDAQVETLHFQGPGTDLHIKLCPQSRWVGGATRSTDGRAFMPNLPTEEVFTTPDWRQTRGRVAVTKPVNVLGEQVLGAWFSFVDGKVVDYGANYGKSLLDRFFAMDPQATFLGEVALVDTTSPIAQTGLVFSNILLDENASCHIALGRGIGMAFAGAETLTTEELHELGCNNSMLHTDFMIGSPETRISGIARTGATVAIMENGLFVI